MFTQDQVNNWIISAGNFDSEKIKRALELKAFW
jgi:hypothetical protein